MLLLVDSGSTKADWRVVDEDGTQITSVITEGLNPYFSSQEKIAATIREKIVRLWISGEGLLLRSGLLVCQ